MSEERKPVICPWCGWDMVAREGQDIFHGKYNVYVCDGCEATSPIAYSEEAAYAAAATQRPPNRPLTKAQIMETPDGIPIVCMNGRYGDGGLHEIRLSHSIRHCFNMLLTWDLSFWRSIPTPADIEAARKERA